MSVLAGFNIIFFFFNWYSTQPRSQAKDALFGLAAAYISPQWSFSLIISIVISEALTMSSSPFSKTFSQVLFLGLVMGPFHQSQIAIAPLLSPGWVVS